MSDLMDNWPFNRCDAVSSLKNESQKFVNWYENDSLDATRESTQEEFSKTILKNLFNTKDENKSSDDYIYASKLKYTVTADGTYLLRCDYEKKLTILVIFTKRGDSYLILNIEISFVQYEIAHFLIWLQEIEASVPKKYFSPVYLDNMWVNELIKSNNKGGAHAYLLQNEKDYTKKAPMIAYLIYLITHATTQISRQLTKVDTLSTTISCTPEGYLCH